jgi:hypothetical protein
MTKSWIAGADCNARYLRMVGNLTINFLIRDLIKAGEK